MRHVGRLLTLLATIGILGTGIYWLMQPCRLLDRVLGISGCAASITLENFSPEASTSLSPQDETGQSSLFGHMRTGDTWQPTLVRLDLSAGKEVSRSKIAVGDGLGHFVFSEDGKRAVMICHGTVACIDGHRSAILSVKDGAILEPRRADDRDYVYFPGDPRPTVAKSWIQLFADNRSKIVDLRSDGSIFLMDSAGKQIALLFEGPRQSALRSGLAVSPSGRYLAMFEDARYGRDASLRVWDLRSGKALRHMNLGVGYRWRFTPVWASNEDLLALMRRDGANGAIDLYRWR